MKKVIFAALAFVGLCSFTSVDLVEPCGEDYTRVYYDCGIACVGINGPLGVRPLNTWQEYLGAVDYMNETCAPSMDKYPSFDSGQ